jgi:hypothetical protein
MFSFAATGIEMDNQQRIQFRDILYSVIRHSELNTKVRFVLTVIDIWLHIVAQNRIRKKTD